MMPSDWRPPTLATDRLVLRPFCEEDVEPLFPLAANPHVTRYTLWDAHQTVEDTRLFVLDYAPGCYREGTPEPYAITRKADSRGLPVGAVGCFWVSRANYTMELGYWVAEPFWGRGFAPEAARALLASVFAEHEVERVQARVIDGNAASVRVLEKVGFRPEGTHRAGLFRRGKFEDVRMFALLRSEWTREVESTPKPLQ